MLFEDHVEVCTLKGRSRMLRSFGTTSRDLFYLSTWLQSCRCVRVAMEKTAPYWETLYIILDESRLKVVVVNEESLQDEDPPGENQGRAGWLAYLLRRRRIENSFFPDKEKEEIRDVAETGHFLPHMPGCRQTTFGELRNGCITSIPRGSSFSRI